MATAVVSSTSITCPTTARSAACETIRAIEALSEPTVPTVRPLRRRLSRVLRQATLPDVLVAAHEFVDAGLAWVGYELIFHHHHRRDLTAAHMEALGRGMDSWGSTDAFGVYIAGPAWLGRQVSDARVQQWTRRRTCWWRRTALVATTVLNARSKGGRGDTPRTLDIARRLVADRDDMVVKALSWALRSLVPWDRRAVQRFLDDHRDGLATRVTREAENVLRTGLKAPELPSVEPGGRGDECVS